MLPQPTNANESLLSPISPFSLLLFFCNACTEYYKGSQQTVIKPVLTDEEKFRFDLEGYLIIKNVLSREQCQRLSDLSDEVWPRTADDDAFRRTSDVSRWGQPFLDLIDHERVLPYLIELIGGRLRIDHDYSIYMQKTAPSGRIHGGPRIFETDHWYYYNDGVMRNGLTVATWALTDAREGDGGFVCIPGSHKTNFMKILPERVRTHDERPEYVRQPELLAGDVLIFTEALMHGTREWTADHERRTLLFKYSPPHSSWAKAPYDPANYPDATEQQIRLMAPPSIEDHGRVVSKAKRRARVPSK